MKIELRDFQRTAVAELISRLGIARLGYRVGQRQAVGLTATTGAGKTIIATAVIEAILKGSPDLGVEADPNAVFLWMTDLPELNAQTQSKMLTFSSELNLGDLPEVNTTLIEERLAPGKVWFLNTQKLGARADLTKRGPLVGRTFTFWDVVRNTIEEEGHTLYLVVDEAHRGMVEAARIDEANSIIQRFIKGYPEGPMPPVPIVLGISATPARFLAVVENTNRTVSRWDVPADDVRASGLIKDRVLADYAGERQTDAMALFPEAVAAWQAMTDAWAAYHDGTDPLVVPALIVQVENEANGRVTETDLEGVIRAVTAAAGNLPDVAFAHAFGEGTAEPVGGRVVRYLEPSRIAADPDARVVFFKTSLGTGWDCPRAEVMFSFRRAVDPTTVAQTIGRMVRTPLARRVEENEALNAAHVFLPHYDQRAVEAIVSHLSTSGNGAIAGTIETRRATVTLPRRADLPEAIAAVEAVPSFLVPTPRARSEVRVLADLANFLARNGIDPEAYRRELLGCAALLVARRDALATDEVFVREVNDQGEILVRRAAYELGAATAGEPETRSITASEESISRLFVAASRRLTSDLAAAYVRARLDQAPGAIGTARLEAHALSAREDVVTALGQHAAGRIDALRAAYGPAVEGLAASHQARYRTILRAAPDPSPVTISLPETIVVARGDDALERHLFADADGGAPIALNGWERDTMQAALADEATVAWLRNPAREGWSLCVPWRDGNTWRGFFPDFLIVRNTGGRLLVDVVDPHDHTKADAVGKAQGLSAYAARHAEQLGHVDLVAKIGTHYRRLHLDDSTVRAEVDALTTGPELSGVYTRRG